MRAQLAALLANERAWEKQQQQMQDTVLYKFAHGTLELKRHEWPSTLGFLITCWDSRA